MHWLEQRVRTILEAEQEYSEKRLSQESKDKKNRRKQRQLRSSFLNDVSDLVELISKIEGIDGCVACHDGLLIAQAGNLMDFDVVGAVTQECMNTVYKSMPRLGMGALRQITVIGDQAKLAVIVTGQISVCIVCPIDTVLSEVLRDPLGVPAVSA